MPARQRVQVIEYRWLEKVQSAEVFACRFDAAQFTAYGAENEPHAFVAHEPVRPLGPAEPIGDVLTMHEQAGIELRLTSNVWPWWREAITTTVRFSSIRLRNAEPEAPQC